MLSDRKRTTLRTIVERRKISDPATKSQIDICAAALKAEFGIDLPENFQVLMQAANGFHRNGVAVFSITAAGPSQPIIDANRELRMMLRKKFWYFGSKDGCYLVFDPESNIWGEYDPAAHECWQTFAGCEEMLWTALEAMLPSRLRTAATGA